MAHEPSAIENVPKSANKHSKRRAMVLPRLPQPKLNAEKVRYVQTVAVTKTKGLYDDFIKFINLGNVFSLAVGIILGTAFTAIVNSLVADVFMPILALPGDGASFDNLFIVLRYGNADNATTRYPTVDQAKAAKAITLNWGRFLQTVLQFFMVAAILFLIVKVVMFLLPKKKEVPSSDLSCPFCRETLKEGAIRCPHCTSAISHTPSTLVMSELM